MSAIIPLGQFERVPLQDAWPTEAGHFTQWLSETAAIKLLSDALNMGLEVEAVEQRVGSFRADIIARSTDETEHRVIIENQFGRTDHSHLGQILTYLAGVEETKTIVWIAETIQPDHRAAIDWLNANTGEDYSFFAIEIELWRIGGSAPAAKFNVVASPNDWTRNTRLAARQVGDQELAERHHMRMAYWASFGEFLKERKSGFQIRRPNKDHWQSFSIGRTDFAIQPTISAKFKRIGVELYINNDASKAFFNALLAQRSIIESDFGEPLDWQELPGKKASRIAVFRQGADPSDEKQYPDLQTWMLNKMERFRSAFATRIKTLPKDGNTEAEDGED